ncbi:hypothetical protein E2C01_018208 [Portunus trituberculatus]|uniref:Uncharacterized protein n=1 Tax=Portunus trituberculatus TaxID=210409 RepID=A0A5B7DVJ0_PORTR|nr:hypothetical protein [Portunus trituberculatus]
MVTTTTTTTSHLYCEVEVSAGVWQGGPGGGGRGAARRRSSPSAVARGCGPVCDSVSKWRLTVTVPLTSVCAQMVNLWGKRYVGDLGPPHAVTISTPSPKPGRRSAQAVAAAAALPRGNKVVSGGGGGGGGRRLARLPSPPVAVPPGPARVAACGLCSASREVDARQRAGRLHAAPGACCCRCTHCSWLRLVTPACRRRGQAG